MVCLLCDSATRITNSRHKRTTATTWRRHTCRRCQAVFTTRESIDMARSYRLRLGSGDLMVFSKETLFMSILEALKHRQAYITESSALLETICAKLIGLKSLIINRDTLVETTASVIKHFDRSAYVRYISMHS